MTERLGGNGAKDQIEPSPIMAPVRDPELTAAQKQIRKLMERAIDQLPDRLRTIFVMRDVEELSTAETAQLLGLGVPTVKTRLHRARRNAARSPR
jgi:RNA polymerase sigma-70 factor (ECF subfamily)